MSNIKVVVVTGGLGLLGKAFLKSLISNGHIAVAADISDAASAVFISELKKLQNKFSDIITEVRGVGFMIGIKINDKIEHAKIVQKFIDHKLLTVPASDNVIRILPPLISTKENIIEALEIIDKSVSEFS